jgi:hypothetical protein
MKPAALRNAGLAAVLCCSSASAAVLTSAALGCKAPSDAIKAATLRVKKDAAGLAAFSQPLIASRSCMVFAKGVTIGIDEKQLPLSCVRLTGDLDCYWVPDALVDLYPGQKGGAGRQGGGGRHQ